MITGFNTDIEHEGVTYHVQTEDKGRSKPIILSLVYNRGTILASKRSPYDDLLEGNFNERILAERLSKQHKLICAAIKAGRIEDLKKLGERETKGSGSTPASTAPPTAPKGKTNGTPQSKSEQKIEAKQSPTPKSEVIAAEKKALITAVKPIAVAPKPKKPVTIPLDDFKVTDPPIPKPNIRSEEKLDDTGLIDEPIIEAVAVIEDEIVLPAEAVEIIGEPVFSERPDNKKLRIEILGDVKFKGGERNTVGFMVSRGTSRKVVSGAEIMVKILGSSFRPVIFHATTDSNGVASVNMQMPKFSTGRAAFLVRAISDGEEIELRRSIAHG